MYKEFANIERLLAGATSDIKMATRERAALLAERDALLKRFDLKVGEHVVPSGKVVVIEHNNSKTVTFVKIDKATQAFARCYAGRCTNIEEARHDVRSQPRRLERLENAHAACYGKFHRQLVDGDYTVATGTVTIANGEATFNG